MVSQGRRYARCCMWPPLVASLPACCAISGPAWLPCPYSASLWATCPSARGPPPVGRPNKKKAAYLRCTLEKLLLLFVLPTDLIVQCGNPDRHLAPSSRPAQKEEGSAPEVCPCLQPWCLSAVLPTDHIVSSAIARMHRFKTKSDLPFVIQLYDVAQYASVCLMFFCLCKVCLHKAQIAALICMQFMFFVCNRPTRNIG